MAWALVPKGYQAWPSRMGRGINCDTACIDDRLYIAAILLYVFLGFAKSRSGKAGLKDLALVNGQPCRDRLT